MSWQALAAVWRADIQPAGLKLVAAVLADRADEHGGSIWFSMDTIAWRAGLSRRMSINHVGTLKEQGLLHVTHPATQHRTPRYRLDMDALAAIARGEAHDTPEGVRGEADCTPESARGEAHYLQGCNAVSPGVKPASPNTPQRRPKTALGGGGAAAAPGLAPGLAAPPGVDASLWAKLAAKRSPAEMQDFAEGIAFYVGRGCPSEAVAAELVRLTIARHHRVFAPQYHQPPKRQARGAARPRRSASARHEDLDNKNYSEGI